MIWLKQPPVFSPVSAGALFAGIAAIFRAQGAAQQVSGELQRRYSATDVVLTDSGTSALVIALRGLVPSGGTVALPGYACVDLTAAALRAGVRVRLYDLDPFTLSPDIHSVEKVMERGVDAIVVAHLYGYPADVGVVQEIAARRGVVVIEDAAQAAGGTLHGVPLGALADVSILSFGRGKGTTAGSGGALLVRTPALAKWTQKIRLGLGGHQRGGREIGALAAQWIFARALLYRIPASIPTLKLGEMVYRPAREPRSISDAAAAILRAALGDHERELAHRRACASKILSGRHDARRFLPVRPVRGGEPGYLRLAVLDRNGNASANESLGAVRGYPITLEQHTQLRPILEPHEQAGEGAEHLRERMFTLPTHSRVGSGAAARLGAWLADSRSALPGEAWAT